MFDLDGKVVGINSQIYSRSGGYQGLAFAIPINVAIDVAEQIIEKGLNYSRIAFTESGAQAYKTIWPAALISYQGKTEPVQFFRSIEKLKSLDVKFKKVPEDIVVQASKNVNSVIDDYADNELGIKIRDSYMNFLNLRRGHSDFDISNYLNFRKI